LALTGRYKLYLPFFIENDVNILYTNSTENKKYKKSQLIMLWVLPLIVIGGLFYFYLGYLVIAMMTFLLIISLALGLFFSKRVWCSTCPMGFL